MKKKERLRNKNTINRLVKCGKKSKNDLFTIYYLKNDTVCNRILVKVPKNCIKKANERNKIRRRIKEIWRTNKQKEYNEQTTYDIMFVYKKTHSSPFSELKQKIKEALQPIYEKESHEI